MITTKLILVTDIVLVPNLWLWHTVTGFKSLTQPRSFSIWTWEMFQSQIQCQQTWVENLQFANDFPSYKSPLMVHFWLPAMFDCLGVGRPEWAEWEYTTEALNLLRNLRSAVDLVVLSSWPDSILTYLDSFSHHFCTSTCGLVSSMFPRYGHPKRDGAWHDQPCVHPRNWCLIGTCNHLLIQMVDDNWQ